GSEVSTKAVVLATGVSVRMLDVPGVSDLLGAGVYYGAAMTEAAEYRDRDVCVLGGANSAGQGAVFFARYARRVTILVRAGLAKAMSHYLVKRIGETPNIDVCTGVEVARVGGTGKLETITLREVATGTERTQEAAALFIFIGAAPHTEMVAGVVERDEKGFILTGPDIPLEKG